MAANSIVKNREYDGVRMSISATNSTDALTSVFYTEAVGYRYFYSTISSTASSEMEAVSFNAYISLTSSGTQSWYFTLVPMDTGESCMIETKALALNQTGLKSFTCKSFGSFRHSGATLSIVGNSFDYDIKTDMYGCDMEFYPSGTSSVCLKITGESGEILDWDILISYTKGYHSLTNPTGGGGGGGGIPPKPWYPPPTPEA